jgi:hypothetical protein
VLSANLGQGSWREKTMVQGKNALFVASLLVCVPLSISCSISDEDRCPDEWFYVPELKVCCPDTHEYDKEKKGCVEIKTEDTNKDDKDAGLMGTSDTSTSTEASEVPEALGKACTNEGGECDGTGAPFCAFHPIRQEGQCTIAGCKTPSDCAGDFSVCCDCENAAIPELAEVGSACLTQQFADELTSYGLGCTCQ